MKLKTTMIVLALGFAPLPAFADTANGTTNQTQNNDDGMDWGWLGLLGLAGLAGLRRQEPKVVHHNTTNTTHR